MYTTPGRGARTEDDERRFGGGGGCKKILIGMWTGRSGCPGQNIRENVVVIEHKQVTEEAVKIG
jgi:hypothetical protein